MAKSPVAKTAVPFVMLRQMMLDLGFNEVVVPKSHLGFYHADSGAEILLPIYRANQTVAPRHLLLVRVTLDGKGLMEGNQFDQSIASSMVRHDAS